MQIWQCNPKLDPAWTLLHHGKIGLGINNTNTQPFAKPRVGFQWSSQRAQFNKTRARAYNSKPKWKVQSHNEYFKWQISSAITWHNMHLTRGPSYSETATSQLSRYGDLWWVLRIFSFGQYSWLPQPQEDSCNTPANCWSKESSGKAPHRRLWNSWAT